jgi:outer membrane receptor protein involved in Fe transport
MISDRVEVHGGLSMYSVRASFGESSFRVYPLAGVSWSVEQWLTLAASYAPSVERSDLAGLFERYPYLRNDVHLAYPEYHTNVALSAGIEPARSVRGTATVRYQRARNLPLLIEGVSGTGEPEGIWDVAYSGTTRIFGLDAEIVVDLSSDISLGASAAWRETRNVSTGKQLPYAPSAELGGTYRHKLNFGLVVQSDLKVLGAQYVDPSNSETIPAYAVWDASAEYEIFPRLTLGVSVRNILEQDQERWRGYRGLPRTASLSGRYIW